MTKRKRGLFEVLWHHDSENSSWWTSEVVRADSAEEAAKKVVNELDFYEHTRHHNRVMDIYVYEISDKARKFKVTRESVIRQEDK